jgi:hypothetical protein
LDVSNGIYLEQSVLRFYLLWVADITDGDKVDGNVGREFEVQQPTTREDMIYHLPQSYEFTSRPLVELSVSVTAGFAVGTASLLTETLGDVAVVGA